MTTLATDTIQPSQATRDANAARYDVVRHAEPCWLCEAGIVDVRWWIEITYRGRLIGADERFNRTDSQGAFAIGPECAAKIPRAFRLNPGDLDRFGVSA